MAFIQVDRMHLRHVSVAPLPPWTMTQVTNLVLLDASRKGKKTGLPFRLIDQVVRTYQGVGEFRFLRRVEIKCSGE